MSVGNTLRKLRVERNMKQTEMADKLGISLSTYSRIENDQSVLDAALLPKIAKEFGTTLDNLLDDGKVIFSNNVQHNKGAGVIVQKGISEAERELYERIISRLEKDLIEQHDLVEGVCYPKIG